MELPFCKNWLEELLADGLSAFELQERLARAGFMVQLCATAELSPAGRPDVVLQAFVGYYTQHFRQERYGVVRAEFGSIGTVDELGLAAIEAAAVELFKDYSATCELCANAEHP